MPSSECTRQAELWRMTAVWQSDGCLGERLALFLVAEQARRAADHADRVLAWQERQRQEWLQ